MLPKEKMSSTNNQQKHISQKNHQVCFSQQILLSATLTE